VTFQDEQTMFSFFGQAGAIHHGSFSTHRPGGIEVIQVSVFRAAPITADTYLGTQVVAGSPAGALLDYVAPSGVVYRSDADQTVRIVVQEISSTAVRGTFEGTVRSASMDEIDITAGEFRVPRDN
jgi:hypothetical protein